MEKIALIVLAVSLAGCVLFVVLDAGPGPVATCLLVGITAAFFGLFGSMMREHREAERLLALCVADGRPEYECHAMTRPYHSRGSSGPVFIPRPH